MQLAMSNKKSYNTVYRRSEDEIYWNAGRNVDVI